MTDAVALWLSERLVAASIQGAGVIALVWLVCRSLSSVPASVRAALWWLAALKLVLTLLPVPAVAIPILPAALDWTHGRPSSAMTRQGTTVDTITGAVVPPRFATESPAVAVRAGSARWLEAVILLWLGIVSLQAARLLMTFRALRGVMRRSVPDADEGVVVARLATRVGLRRAPPVRTSAEIDAPQVAGLWRPVVLVPAGIAALTDEERVMTLCHELMHIRRRDLALGWVPALAERLFFFHPLARLAAREYIDARESASDAAVVRALGVSPSSYGRLLVRLGIAAPPTALTAGGAPPSISSLRRRLEMLQHAASPESSRRSRWFLAAMVCALIPLHVVARTEAGQEPASVRQVPEAPTPVSATVVPPAPQEAAPRSAAPVEPVPAEAAPRTVGPVEPPPAEAARQAWVDAEAAWHVDLAASQQDLEKSLAEIVRRLQDAGALRQKSTEHALQLELERQAADEQRRAAEMHRLMELAKRGLMPRSLVESEQARAEQESRDARERMLELMARRPQAESSLNGQLEQLNRQVEVLSRQMTQIAEQQEQLAAAQRRLAEQAEQIRRLSDDTERIRKAIEAR